MLVAESKPVIGDFARFFFLGLAVSAASLLATVTFVDELKTTPVAEAAPVEKPAAKPAAAKPATKKPAAKEAK